jgi:hypothetical protein
VTLAKTHSPFIVNGTKVGFTDYLTSVRRAPQHGSAALHIVFGIVLQGGAGVTHGLTDAGVGKFLLLAVRNPLDNWEAWIRYEWEKDAAIGCVTPAIFGVASYSQCHWVSCNHCGMVASGVMR